MREPHVRGSRPSDIYVIMDQGLREQDRKELDAMGVNAEETLRHGLKNSDECLTVVVDSVPVAMFGVVRHTDISGIVWFLGTDGLFNISRQFLTESKHWLNHISKGYLLVGNIVHVENTISIRWLQWLGFTFLARQGDFIEFARIN